MPVPAIPLQDRVPHLLSNHGVQVLEVAEAEVLEAGLARLGRNRQEVSLLLAAAEGAEQALHVEFPNPEEGGHDPQLPRLLREALLVVVAD
jgi:hypothetical protein